MELFDQAIPPKAKQKSNEWYTPAPIIEAARLVMGGIDLDPASCSLANQTVRAAHYYTVEDDGLARPWFGRVWCNPPFSAENANRGMEPGRTAESVIKYWIRRLILEYDAGNISEAVLLSKVDMKAAWFHTLWRFVICFSRDHLYFYRPGLPPEKHQFGTCFVYLGPNEARFIETFRQFGIIARAVAFPPDESENQLQPTLWGAYE